MLNHRGLRNITSTLNVAAILRSSPSFEIIFASTASSATGRQFKAAYGTIGTSGMETDETRFAIDSHGVRVAQAIIENSRQPFLVADQSNFARDALARFGSLVPFDASLADRPSPAHILAIPVETKVALPLAEAPKLETTGSAEKV